jgi:hypothetical protein
MYLHLQCYALPYRHGGQSCLPLIIVWVVDRKLCDRFFSSAFRDVPDVPTLHAGNASAVSRCVCVPGRYDPALRDDHPPEIDSDLADRASGAPTG